MQGVLAPLQFVAFAISLALVLRYLATGRGYEAATVSILIKTVALFTIMITGSIWEKKVFGRWLFAPAFFWEDVFSMLVLGLQTAYVVALVTGWGTARQQMLMAVAAYAAYAVNATQFLLKLRAARLDGRSEVSIASHGIWTGGVTVLTAFAPPTRRSPPATQDPPRGAAGRRSGTRAA